MSTEETTPTPEAAIGTVKDVEATELTEQERMARASDEVATILNKYNVTITVQSVPVIVPAQAREPASDLKP
jgi:hypothetical protein